MVVARRVPVGSENGAVGREWERTDENASEDEVGLEIEIEIGNAKVEVEVASAFGFA